MKHKPNEGLGKMYWIFLIAFVFLFALAAVLWWYDYYLLH
jgi:hypothetical protein